MVRFLRRAPGALLVAAPAGSLLEWCRTLALRKHPGEALGRSFFPSPAVIVSGDRRQVAVDGNAVGQTNRCPCRMCQVLTHTSVLALGQLNRALNAIVCV